MTRFGKYTALIYVLLALVALEFIGLAGALLLPVVPSSEPLPSSPAEEAPAPLSDEIPAWLAPAEPITEAAAAEKAPPAGELTAAQILSGERIVSHGMGIFRGRTTLNCLEAFEKQYKSGVRVFEVDLRLTSDQKVVLRHDWRAGWQEDVAEISVPTLEEFLSKPILQRYTPLSFQDLLLLMEEYPDICIITDTKFTDAEIVKLQFEAMLQDGEELGLSYLFNRMVIQVYNPLMFRVVESVHHFPYYIYTLYTSGFSRTEEDFEEKAAFCADSGIMGITMWDYWWLDEFAPIADKYHLQVYTHTVNDADSALRLLESGVSAVYTDQLTPADLETEEAEEGENNGTDRKDVIE